MNVIDPARACPSRLRFDRLLAGELEAAYAQELSAHAAQCARCGALLAELRQGRDAFVATAVFPAAVAERVRERVQRRGPMASLRWTAPMLAAAAALLAFMAWPKLVSDAADSVTGERTKGGGVELSFYVLHDGAVRPGVHGERVQPGDRLEFMYTSEREAYLAIVSIDATRKASAYYEKDGLAALLKPARRGVLDRSTLLDDTLGFEVIYTLACAKPIAVAPILQALERAPDTVPDAPGCTIESHALLKVPR